MYKQPPSLSVQSPSELVHATLHASNPRSSSPPWAFTMFLDSPAVFPFPSATAALSVDPNSKQRRLHVTLLISVVAFLVSCRMFLRSLFFCQPSVPRDLTTTGSTTLKHPRACPGPSDVRQTTLIETSPPLLSPHPSAPS